MQLLGLILDTALFIYIIILFARFVVDWVQVFARSWTPKGGVMVLLELIYSATDPPINAVRRVLPPIRLGAMMLDLSPMIVLVICILLRIVIGMTLLSM